MKTIKVSDEMYAFLIDLSKKMNTQDNRATANPYMYIITEMVERPTTIECGDPKFIDDEGDEVDLVEMSMVYQDELKEYAKNKTGDYHLTDDIIEDYLSENNIIREIYFTTERECLNKMQSNVFFTEDAVKQHIKRNNYHYHDAQDFLIHVWRNPEMSMVHKFLKGLIKR